MRNRGTAILAAGISCIFCLLLTAHPRTAQADELTQLRANQALLEQRLDQLAQAPPAPGGVYPSGPPAKTAGAGTLAGSFPRSFLIPGTDTSIRIGGTIDLHVMHFFNGGNAHTTTASTTNFGNKGALNTAPLHVHVSSIGPKVLEAGNPSRSTGNNLTFISPQRSKVNFETRTPTPWGEARTFLEFDWANGNQFLPGNNALMSTNNLVPRLRFAYATLGGLLGGQAVTNFGDPDARTENLNVGRNVADLGTERQPQVRYTWSLMPYGAFGALSVSAEAPETDGWVPGGGTGAVASDFTVVPPTAPFVDPFKAPVPDLTAAWYIPQPWGHMDFSGVVRPELQMKDGQFLDRTFTGYGLHFSGVYKPGWFDWKKDSMTWQFAWGDGIGRYLGNNSFFAIVSNYPAALPVTKAAAGLVRAQLTTAWGGQTGYQHWWTPTLRSNLGFGIIHHDINNLGGPDGFVCSGPGRFSGSGSAVAGQVAGTGCALNKELISSTFNLIWNPVPFGDIGIEYFWGHRLVLSNLKGDVNGVISRFRINF